MLEPRAGFEPAAFPLTVDNDLSSARNRARSEKPDALSVELPRHSQAAKEIAAEYFNAEKLLRQVMIEAGL